MWSVNVLINNETGLLIESSKKITEGKFYKKCLTNKWTTNADTFGNRIKEELITGMIVFFTLWVFLY